MTNDIITQTTSALTSQERHRSAEPHRNQPLDAMRRSMQLTRAHNVCVAVSPEIAEALADQDDY